MKFTIEMHAMMVCIFCFTDYRIREANGNRTLSQKKPGHYMTRL